MRDPEAGGDATREHRAMGGVVAEVLEADYLVVGAGTTGMAFVDAVIDDPDAEVVVVDRRAAPGGHWLDSYPFVRLHQPSANYGVGSTPLGLDRIDEEGTNRGFLELAGGAEVCAYFAGVLRHRLIPSGRVRFLPCTEHLGDGRLRNLLTGATSTVAVRRRLVDATLQEARVPATHGPPFTVDPSVRCVPVGDLVGVREPPVGFVVIGGGKTAMDACSWLLASGTPPERITWIRPRDSWALNRAYFQPGPGAPAVFEGATIQLEAIAEADTVGEVYARLEEAGVMLRLDPEVEPTVCRGATMSVAERDELRRIHDVVRLGHVRRIEADRIVLDHGEVPTSPEHLHVHCAAPGLTVAPPTPVFAPGAITLQPLTRISLSLAAALIGFVEATDRTDEDKNRLLVPVPYPDTAFDYLRAITLGFRNEATWAAEPDIQAWMDDSRLNVTKGLAETGDLDHLRDLQRRFVTALFPALEKIPVLAREADPVERDLIYPPLDTVA